MNDAVSSQILFDLLLLDTMAIGFGLVVFACLRVIQPLDRWEARGNVYSAVFGWQELVLLIVVVGWMLASLGVAPGISEGAVDEIENAGQTLSPENIFVGAIFQLLLVGVMIAFLTRVREIDLSEAFGLERLGKMRVLGWSLLVLLPALPVISGITFWFNSAILEPAWGEIDPQPVVEAVVAETSIAMQLLFAVSAIVIAPLCEEFFFRGVIYGVLKRFGERIFANVASSIFFAAIHMHVPGVLPLTLLAVVLCIAYEITGCLWVPVVMHSLFNALNLGLMWTTGVEL